jgi:hypothetical protein
MVDAFLTLAGWLLRLAWRFVTGERLRGYGPFDGSFLYPAPEHTSSSTGRQHHAPRSWWARMAGYKRALCRNAALAAILALALYPVLALAGLVLLAPLAGAWAVRRARERRYIRDVLQPIWDALAPVVGAEVEADPREWLSVPPDPADPAAVVVVGLPSWFHPTREALAKITAVVNDRVEAGPWVLRRAPFRAEFRHASARLQPIWAAIAPLLGMDPLLSPAEDYLTLPAEDAGDDDVDAESRRVRLLLPAGFRPADTETWRRVSDTITHRVPGGPWEEHSSYAHYRAEWRPVPKPPRRLNWAEIAPAEGGSIHEIPVGVGARHKLIKVSMLSESPHWFITAGTGKGKTSTLRIPIAWVRERGGLVDIIDLKRSSFVELAGASGVRLHTDMDAAVWAFGEFYVSMTAVFTAIAAGKAKAADVPPRYLVIDEFGSLMDIARQWWRLRGGKGEPPFLLAWKVIGYQGRQANHRMIVGVHSPTAQLFGGTNGKDLFATRLLLGAPSPAKWLMTFGDAPKVQYDATRDGRGLIGYGASAVEEIQVGWLSGEDARARLEASAPAPEWFDRHELPPWVTQAALDAAAADVGINWLSRPGTDVEESPADAEPAPRVPETSMRSRTSAHRPILRVVPDDAAEPVPATAPADDEGDELVVGLLAAARTIGTTPEAFRKARDRWRASHGEARLPGETRRGDRVAFHRLELIRWHAGRKIAGRELRGGR